MSDYVKNTNDWLDKIVECPWCPDCYQHKRHKYYDKESDG